MRDLTQGRNSGLYWGLYFNGITKKEWVLIYLSPEKEWFFFNEFKHKFHVSQPIEVI